MDEKQQLLARMALEAQQDKFRNLLKWYGVMVRAAAKYKMQWAEAFREMHEGVLEAVKQEAQFKRMWMCRKAEAVKALELIRNHEKLKEMEEETAKFICLSAERMMRELDDANNIAKE